MVHSFGYSVELMHKFDQVCNICITTILWVMSSCVQFGLCEWTKVPNDEIGANRDNPFNYFIVWNCTTFYGSFDLVCSLFGCHSKQEIDRSMRLNCGGIMKISHEWQNRRLVFKTPLEKNCTIVEKLANATIRQINSLIRTITRVLLKTQLWKYNHFTSWGKIPMLYEHFIYYSITNTLIGLSLNRLQCELRKILINFVFLLRKINIACHSTSMYTPVEMQDP